jgi:hypothetical protein
MDAKAKQTHNNSFFIASFITLFQRCFLEFLESAAELVWTGSPFGATADAIELMNHIVDALAPDQLADTLQVTIASSEEKDLLDNIVLISGHVDQLRACALRLVLYMFCLHIFWNLKNWCNQ